MKTCLKTIVLSALSALVVFTGITYTSCKPDKCKAITCAYGGVCNGGECTCATGYEGIQCEKRMRDKFTGSWRVTEAGTITGSAIYDVPIEDAQAIQDVTIGNFINLFPGGVRVMAYVSGDTIYIPLQEVFNRRIQGVGYINPNLDKEENSEIIMRYHVVDSAGRINDFGWDKGNPSIWDLMEDFE